MSVLTLVALLTVVIMLAAASVVEQRLQDEARTYDHLNEEQQVIRDVVAGGFRIVALTVWPSFVMNGLVQSQLSTTLAMQAGIITVCYIHTTRGD